MPRALSLVNRKPLFDFYLFILSLSLVLYKKLHLLENSSLAPQIITLPLAILEGKNERERGEKKKKKKKKKKETEALSLSLSLSLTRLHSARVALFVRQRQKK